MNKYSVGDFIYKKRKEKNLTQSQLGDMLGVSNKAVSKWETGESFPEFSLIQPLCEILGISADELISGKERSEENFDGEKENCSKTDGQENREEFYTQNFRTASERDKNLENNYYKEEDDFYKEQKREQPAPQKPLSLAFIAFEKRFFAGIAVAVFLIIASIAALFLSQYLGMKEDYSACVMLSICAVAVYLFVHFGMKYDAYKKGTDEYVNAVAKFTWILPVGVAMCVFSPCIILLIGGEDGTATQLLAMCAFFVWLAVAVLIIVFSSLSFKRSNDFYGVTDSEAKQEQWQDRACGVIMMTAVIIYLILGFVFEVWHPGWIVFPIGGIICGILGATKKNDHNK